MSNKLGKRKRLERQAEKLIEVAVHEAGHAVCCERYGLPWLAVVDSVGELGGICFHGRQARHGWQGSIIACGGSAGVAVGLMVGAIPAKPQPAPEPVRQSYHETARPFQSEPDQRKISPRWIIRANNAAAAICYDQRERLLEIAATVLRVGHAGDARLIPGLVELDARWGRLFP